MNEKTALKEGETLLILQRKSGKSVSEVAKLLDIHPNHLSKIFKSEFLSAKIRKRAAEVFEVPESVFSRNTVANFPQSVVNEPEPEYVKGKRRVEDMTAAEVLRYLEEKDKRHFEERARLLGIIEKLAGK